MKNALVSDTLRELSAYTEMEDPEPYRARAYKKAAQSIDSLPFDIETLAREGRLGEIPGVGENIAKKIIEIVQTGKLASLEKLKSKTPIDATALLRVEGIGPKTMKSLYNDLKIKDLDTFEEAVKEGRLENYKGLGIKGTKRLLERIENARLKTSRLPLVEAQSIANKVSAKLEAIPGVKRYALTGSYRRMKETIGDLDALITSDSPDSIEAFTKDSGVKEVIAAGELKASVKFEKNFQVDVRVVPKESWGAAMVYFTGSKAHNIELRTRAIKMGYSLNEYGLYKASDRTRVDGSSESDVYSSLGIDYIEPELREARGEIQAAEKHSLPRLVSLSDIKGDLQMHTTWSDGKDSIKSMAETGMRAGYEYIATTDHVGSLKIANAMDEERIRAQGKEIEKLNKEYEDAGTNFHILQGAEVNIRADGTLDMPDRVLKELDIVLASIHTGFTDDEEKIMKRFEGALSNENVDVIAHPTGRLILERTGYKIDLMTLIERAVETETVLEMDIYPNRLDLNDESAFEAIKGGCVLSVDTDAHSTEEMEYMKLGISQPRRAWATRQDILNSKNYNELVSFLV